MGVDLAKVLQDFSSAVDFIRKTNEQIYDVYVNPAPKDVTIYGPDGQVISSVPNRAKLVAEFEDWKANVRREYPAVNLLDPLISLGLKTDSNGNPIKPPIWVGSGIQLNEYSIVEREDTPIEDFPILGCNLSYKVYKIDMAKKSDEYSFITFPAYNCISGHITAGALVIHTTGKVKIHSLEFQAGETKQKVIVYAGYRNWGLDAFSITLLDANAIVYIAIPWVVAGIWSEVGENKPIPLIVSPNGGNVWGLYAP
jgi:hypothetical protein